MTGGCRGLPRAAGREELELGPGLVRADDRGGAVCVLEIHGEPAVLDARLVPADLLRPAGDLFSGGVPGEPRAGGRRGLEALPADDRERVRGAGRLWGGRVGSGFRG